MTKIRHYFKANQVNGAIFQGNFDGNGKVVSGIVINRGRESYIGLFGYVYNAKIENLGVEIPRSIKGYKYVGGLIGNAENSIIKDCYATGSVTGNTAVGGLIGNNDIGTVTSNCYATCDVIGYSDVGGFAGTNYGTIHNSFANGVINQTDYNLGGFVGCNYNEIHDCYASGNVTGLGWHIGGFAGANKEGIITYCYATEEVTGIGSADYIGGFTGINTASLHNCVAANKIISGGISYVNRFAGYVDLTPVSHNYALSSMIIQQQSNGEPGDDADWSELISYNFYNNGNNWYNGEWIIESDDYPNPNADWKICDGEMLPILQWQDAGIVCNPCNQFQDGSINSPFLICTVQDLVDLANNVNTGTGNYYPGSYWKLMNDLDLSIIANWNPIGNFNNRFQGNFDGNTKVISNLAIYKPTTDYIGLFGFISNAEIKNLGIEDCQVAGDQCVGALVGRDAGNSNFESCYVIDICVSGNRLVGGLIGAAYYYPNLTIQNCYAIGSVTGVADCVGGLAGCINFDTFSVFNTYAICEVNGTSAVGGLIGIGANSGMVEISYANGNIQGTNVCGGLVGALDFWSYIVITDCYATGNVIANSAGGGLIGGNPSNTNLANCYATGNVTANSSIGGLVGGNSGSITNCYATGNVVTVASGSGIGGLVGNNSGSIAKSYATGNITLTGASNSDVGGFVGFYSSLSNIITNCYSAGHISLGTSNSNVGGFVGNNLGSITCCYATSNIFGTGNYSNIGGFSGSNSTINSNLSNSYSSGNINIGASNTNIGGVVGNNSGSITYCYATGNITGTGGTYFGGVVGYSLGTLRNCVAVNTAIAGASSNINRVAGFAAGGISNNYAYNGMTINPSGGVAGFPQPMTTLMSFNFYNDDDPINNTWYSNTPWNIDKVDNPLVVWKICDGTELPFFQWQGLDCSKSLMQENDNDEYHFSEQNTKSSFSIFPSPTSNDITISSKTDFHYLEIIDLLGRVVHFQTNNGNNITLNISNYSTGVYFVRIITDYGFEVQKFAKK